MGRLWRRTAKGFVVCAAAAMMFCSGMSDSTSASSAPGVSKKLVLSAGETGYIKVSGKYIISAAFRSDNNSLASVGKKGKVTAKKVGTCKIKVTVKYKKTKRAKKIVTKNYVCTVSVKKNSGEAAESTPAPVKPVEASTFIRQGADFSVRLLQKNAAETLSEGKNVLLSPESVLCALAMTANGAAGDTLAEFQSVLYPSMSQDEFNQELSQYNRRLTGSEKVQFSIADSIWVRDNAEQIQMKDSFLAANEKYFDAESVLAPFDHTTVQEVNDWVKRKTNGMIDQILENEISESVMAFLVNAVTFEGKWRKQYTEEGIIENQAFTNAEGSEESVTMLSGEENQYISDEKAKGFVKKYEGGGYAFMAILPDEGVTVSDYLEQLTGEKLLSLYQNRTSHVVLTKMPEFTYDYSTGLDDSLKDMGLQRAFLPEADFSNMAATGSENLFISQVLHKAHIELDRNGTKAAAVTAVIMEATSAVVEKEPPKEVYLDRPFLYAIIDTETGFPIFIGVVNTVAG